MTTDATAAAPGIVAPAATFGAIFATFGAVVAAPAPNSDATTASASLGITLATLTPTDGLLLSPITSAYTSRRSASATIIATFCFPAAAPIFVSFLEDPHLKKMQLVLPPPGASVRYLNASRRHWMRDLAEPRMYLTLASHGTVLKRLVFVEWNAAHFGLDFNDALDVWSSKGQKLADVLDAEPALGLLDSSMRAFLDALGESIKRRNAAIVAYDDAMRRMGAVYAYLAFWATVATPDDPVTASALTPIENIARAALAVDSTRAAEIAIALAKASAAGKSGLSGLLKDALLDIVCDVLAVVLVYGTEAVQIKKNIGLFVGHFVASAVGRFLSGLVGEEGVWCVILILIDAVIMIVAVLVPAVGGPLIATSVATAGSAAAAGFASAIVRGASSNCRYSIKRFLMPALDQCFSLVAPRIDSLVNLNLVDIYKKVMTNLTTQNLKHLGPAAIFMVVDGIISGVFGKIPRDVRCFVTLLVHYMVGQKLHDLDWCDSRDYMQNVVPTWMRINFPLTSVQTAIP
jgi:hypothetical protein